LAERTKLQKAVETSITAGYQLNSEAFEFLTSVAATEDPTLIVSKALLEIEKLEDKPLFIEKEFLQKIRKHPEPKTQEPGTHIPPEETIQEKTGRQTPEAASLFQPFAKDVEPDIKVIDDPTGKLSSNGTIEDYLQYFQDRFKRLERLLRQRIDVRAATPILEALKSQPRAKLKIVCMVTEKRESKQNIILTVEDLETSATVLINHNAPESLHKKAQMLLLDQVVCLAVVKTRSRLFLAEDIIFPEVGQKPPHRAPEPVYAVLTSDLHVGSTKFNKDAFKRFILWLNGKYGNDRMKEMAGHVKYFLVAGDIVDGVGVYPNQVKELLVKDVNKQYRLAAKLIEKIPDYIEIVIAPGNHDAPRKALPQPAISNEFLSELQQT
jgi:DNA polymerase II small subunit